MGTILVPANTNIYMPFKVMSLSQFKVMSLSQFKVMSLSQFKVMSLSQFSSSDSCLFLSCSFTFVSPSPLLCSRHSVSRLLPVNELQSHIPRSFVMYFCPMAILLSLFLCQFLTFALFASLFIYESFPHTPSSPASLVQLDRGVSPLLLS